MNRCPRFRDARGGRCGGVAALVAASLALAGCGTTLPDRSSDAGKPATAAAAPASETLGHGQAPAESATTGYVVQRGDTLSALSRRHGTSVARLAALNDLPPPYLLKVGQTLRLPTAAPAPVATPDGGARLAALPTLPGAQPAAAATGAPVPQPAPRAAVTEAALPMPAAAPAQPDATVAGPRPAQAKPGARPAAEPYVVPSLAAAADGPPASKASAPPPPADRSEKPPMQAQTVATAPVPAPPARSGSGFLMPVGGRIIAGFGPQRGGLHNDGINIAAAKGTPVKAADNGVVVYAGNELRGFGNMLLVQHAGGWMTSYAHLDSMSVARGQHVKRGQKIGTVGMTGNVTAPQLHFEVRQGKQPVDPEKQMAQSGPRTAMIGQLR